MSQQRAPRKFIQVNPDVNHNAIGCTFSHFVAHIENKPLQVEWMDQTKVNVRDQAGMVWTILRKDVTDAKAPAHA